MHQRRYSDNSWETIKVKNCNDGLTINNGDQLFGYTGSTRKRHLFSEGKSY